jgi:hypothetical protein
MEAPLNERLAAYANALRELNFPFAVACDELFARLYSGDVCTTAPAIGDPMPPFMLPALPERCFSKPQEINSSWYSQAHQQSAFML